MKNTNHTKNNNNRKALHLILIAIGVIFGIYLSLVLIEFLLFSAHFGPFKRIAGVYVGGKTKSQAVTAVNNAWADYKTSDITIDQVKYKPGDLVTEVKVNETVDQSIKNGILDYFTLMPLRPSNVPVTTTLNNQKISEILNNESAKQDKTAVDAKIILSPETQIIPEKLGQKLLLAESRSSIQNGLALFKTNLELKISRVEPSLTEAEARNLVENAKAAVGTDITVKSSLGNFVISKTDLEGWLKIAKTTNNNYTYFDKEKVNIWVNNLSSKLNRDAKNATLGATNGQISVVAPAQTGYQLDKKDLEEKIQAAATGSKTVSAKIKETQPEITENKISELGLKELVSTGFSDFAGSPANRKVNIQVGATKFNGKIIKPGEEFSFDNTLGPVDASTGFLPELVIKNNKTEPEYGGGLCQVSSTAFRAALNAGLPITARYAHAYPVVYYKPYGVDATIYLPWPDLKFVNDTGHYILIQTRISGTKLYFDFYGTKAARTIKFSGNKDANGAVNIVEKVNPTITDVGARGKNSFTATFYRHTYDASGKLIKNEPFVSKYDSPDKYPH